MSERWVVGATVKIRGSMVASIVGSVATVVADEGSRCYVKLAPEHRQWHALTHGGFACRCMRKDLLMLQEYLTPFEQRVRSYIDRELPNGQI